MKKAVVAIWLVIYLAVSTGVLVSDHYCMNRLASTKLFSATSKTCGKCGMTTERSHGCCRDEWRIVKMDDDQRLSLLADWKLEMPALPAIQWMDTQSSLFALATHPTLAGNLPPPPLHRQDTYLQIGVFRI